jgi:hypothetical protein
MLAVLAAALAVLGLVVSMIVPAVADNGGERVTLRLGERFADDEQYGTLIDVGKKGFSVGDYNVVQNEPSTIVHLQVGSGRSAATC